MNYTNENVEFLQSKEIQNNKSIKKNGILIYQEAKTKLQISNGGWIYKQKALSFIPIIGPLFSAVYANLCIGKTRCLRKQDSEKFKSAGRTINLFAFLIWPIIFLGLWTLIHYLISDFAWGGSQGAYLQMWNQTINTWDQILTVAKTDTKYIGLFVGSLFQGLFQILIQPLGFTVIAGTQFIAGIPLNDIGAVVPNNILFIGSIFILTWINPVNIVNSVVLNTKKRRFIVVLENSSVYQYRNK